MKEMKIVCIILSMVMIFFMPAASAGVTNFNVTPADNKTGAVSSYTIQVNTTGFTSLNITIPSGFKANYPSSGMQIGKVDLWGTSGYFGNVTFTANATYPLTRMDVNASIVGVSANNTQNITYTEGGIISITSPLSGNEKVNLTLPTASAAGKLNITVLTTITNVTVTVNQFVKNPMAPGDYVFYAEGVPRSVHIVAPVPEFNIFGLIALAALLSILAFVRLKRKD